MSSKNNIQNLPKGWLLESFDNIVENHDGQRIPIKSENRKNGKYPYYGATGIIDYVDDYIFDGEYLLISEDGANLLARTYPIAFIAEGKFWVNNHAHIVSAKPNKSTNKYLKYYFDSIDISEFVTGSAQPKLNQKKLNSILIPIPRNYFEQERIVARLDALLEKLDAAIELAEENLEHLSHLLPAALNEVFDGSAFDNWVDCTYDDIQKDNLIGLVRNSTEQNPLYPYKYVKMNNISTDNYLDLTKVTCINADQNELKKFGLHEGDFLFNTRNSTELVGKTAVYDSKEKNVLFNNNILRTRFKDGVDPYFIAYQFKTSNVINQLENMKSGTTNVAAIYYKNLAKLKLKLPHPSTQSKIVDYFNQLTNYKQQLKSHYESKLKYLRALKASLLDAAFKGEL